MKLTIPFLLLSILLAPYTMYGQSNDYNIAPPSPEAASLGKYAEHEVSLYTGTPKIEIPLFNIKTGRINVPITLSYHASGIKVEQTASRVGMGWSLNAGGIITRSVRGGKKDEYLVSRGSCGPDNSVYPCIDRGHFYMGEDFDFDPSEENYFYSEHDSSPDLFFYNFGNYTGEFVFKEDRTLILKKVESFEMEHPFGAAGSPIPALPDEFKITTNEGLIYTFNSIERSEIQNTFDNYISAWLLTEIYDPISTRSVGFEYTTLSNIEVYNFFGFKYWDDDYQNCQIQEVLGGLTNFKSTNQMLVLNKITFDEGYILFETNHDREDLIGDKAITKISKYNFNDELIQSFDLNYEYAQTNGCTNQELCKRLFLTSLTPRDKSNNELNPFSFEYDSKNQIPRRYSAETDAWGFYNANGATTYKSKIHIYKSLGKDQFSPVQLNGLSRNFIIDGASKECNSTAILYGTLNKITYPTGGYTEFEYEPHQFEYHGATVTGGGIRIKSQSSYPGDGSVLIKEYQYDEGMLPGLIPQYAVYNGIWNSSATQTDYENNLLRFSLNQAILGASNGSAVGYSKVIERNKNATGQYLGKTEYYYSNVPDESPTYVFSEPVTNGCVNSLKNYSRYPFYNQTDFDSHRGQILNVKVFEGSETSPQSETTYQYLDYGDILGSSSPSYAITKPLWVNHSYWFRTSVDASYEYRTDSRVVSEVAETIYDDNQIGKTTTKEFTYKVNYLLASESNEDITVKYKYPQDFSRSASSNVIGQMMDKNYINTPIVTQKWKNGRLINESAINFINDGGLLLPGEIFNRRITKPLDAGDVGNITDPASLNSDTYELSVDLQNYDSHGRLLQATASDGLTYKYIWRDWRQDKYPTAKIVGQAGYIAVETCDVSNGSLDATVVSGSSKTGRGYCNAPTSIELWRYNGSTGSDPLYVSFWARNANLTLSNSSNSQTISAGSSWQFFNLEMPSDTYLKLVGTGNIDEFRVFRYDNTQITTYDYENLIGLKSINDPSGVISKYFYDSMGRLMFVKDASGNIIKAFDYSLK